MKQRITIIQRFLLPVALLVIASAVILAKRETYQQMRALEHQAHWETAALIRLLNTTESLVKDRVSASLSLLKERGNAIGPPSIKGKTIAGNHVVPNLLFGKEPQTYRFALVDGIVAHFGIAPPC